MVSTFSIIQTLLLLLPWLIGIIQIQTNFGNAITVGSEVIQDTLLVLTKKLQKLKLNGGKAGVGTEG